MDAAIRAEAEKVAKEIGLELDLKQIWYSPPVKFADGCVAAVRSAAEELGYAAYGHHQRRRPRRLLHSRVAPTGMVFVPCENGISHNEIENATKEDLAAGCDVLLRAIVTHANA